MSGHEFCSKEHPKLRAYNDNGSMLDYRGVRAGKLLVIGLAEHEYSSGYARNDKFLPSRANARRSEANYLGKQFQRTPARRDLGSRWVCKCDCGNYALRSSKGIRLSLGDDSHRDWPDACVDCRNAERDRRACEAVELA